MMDICYYLETSLQQIINYLKNNLYNNEHGTKCCIAVMGRLFQASLTEILIVSENVKDCTQTRDTEYDVEGLDCVTV